MSKIRITESDLHQIIKESVQSILNEQMNEELEENWFGDKWKQTKSAFSTATQNNWDLGLKDRFTKAKQNWNSQGELNSLNNLAQQLSQFVDAGQLNPQMTIAQLIGGKYNGGRFGRMSGMAANRKGQISRRGGSSY
ncbi:MAG: hypothetical protein HUK13_10090 [Muribaculaceae bacterium]|nr:hypothetical protein [Muribaculaceae bacterium]MCF0214761.1 hypothetical protein [Muribaculaceae bacterium]